MKDLLDSVLNLILVCMWLRIVPKDASATYMNPYAQTMLRIPDRIYEFVRPIAGRMTREFALLAVLVFALAFRGVAMNAFNNPVMPWTVRVGLWSFSAPPLLPGRCAVFSVVCFMWLLFRIWLLDFAVTLLRRKRYPTHASSLLTWISMPVSSLHIAWRGAFLAGFAGLIGLLLCKIGMPVRIQLMDGKSLVFAATAFQMVSFIAFAALEVLQTAATAIMIAIAVSLVGMFSRSPQLIMLSNDALEVLVGSVFRRPIVWRNFNFTPLVFFFGASIIYQVCAYAIMVTQVMWV